MTRKILCVTTLALASLAFVPLASAQQTPPANGNHPAATHHARSTQHTTARHNARPSTPAAPRTGGSGTTH